VAEGAQVLGGGEAEGAAPAHAAGAFPVARRADRLGGILDDADIQRVLRLARDLVDRLHVGALPEEVHRDDGARAGEMASATRCGSRLKVSDSMSTNTGFAPARWMH